MRRSGFGLVAAAVGLATGCGGPGEVELIQLRSLSGDRTFLLESACRAEDGPGLAVVVVETDEDVSLMRRAEVLTTDACDRLALVELSEPIGTRQLTVEGSVWIRVDADCNRAVYRPADPAEGELRPARCGVLDGAEWDVSSDRGPFEID